jgi:uncharacterized membrane protein
MVTIKKMTSIQRSWPLWRWILTGLNILALILSGILSWHYLAGGSMVGCGGGSPCDLVLNSPWSVIAGRIPVSGLAVGLYLALLVASLYIGQATEAPVRRLAWSVMLVIAGSVAGSAIWFTILQKWVIGAFCPYCMTTHISGLLLASIVIWRSTRELSNNSDDISLTSRTKVQKISSTANQHFIRRFSVIGKVLTGMVLTGILAIAQFIFTPAVIYRNGDSQDKLPAINYNDVPMVGSPDAPYIVTLLFDYQCPHCQKLHFILNEAIRAYNGKLAFVLRPAPLNNKCNPFIPQDADAYKNSCELAKIGLAVWVARRDAFPEFENWMFSFESGNRWQPRSLESTMAKAVELVGKEKLDTAMTDPWIERYLQNCIQIYGQTIKDGKGGVPKLIFGSHWVIPELYDAADLIMILQNSLDVPRP